MHEVKNLSYPWEILLFGNIPQFCNSMLMLDCHFFVVTASLLLSYHIIYHNGYAY